MLAAVCSGCGPASSQYRDLQGMAATPPYDSTWGSPGVGVFDLTYSDFLNRVEKNEVRQVALTGAAAFGELTSGKRFRAVVPDDPSLIGKLLDHHVEVRITPKDDVSVLLARLLIGSLLGFVVVGFAMYYAGPSQGGERTVPFGRSRARSLPKAARRTTFGDVAGIDEAVQDLREIVEFLRNPDKFRRLGGRIPRGILLAGPPGAGKTLIARAVAGEADVPFFIIPGSDFVEKFIGVGASRVRDMFDEARKNAPCIIFIDEIDAVGRRRGGGNDEREQTLNQLLVEMDGFETSEGIILIAATNRPDVLDPALLRPGRFDRQVEVPNPDVMGREAILKVHVRKVPLAPDVNLKTVARGAPGFSGADLMNLVNEAALMAARRNKCVVTQLEFGDAKDKVMMGAERRSLAMSDGEKLLTAYHEAGHAIVAFHAKATDPVHKATIIPRGRSLGMVTQLLERDKLYMSLEQMTFDLGRLEVRRSGETTLNKRLLPRLHVLGRHSWRKERRK
jgi:cell division protease FtsH